VSRSVSHAVEPDEPGPARHGDRRSRRSDSAHFGAHC
jgi:hypothetical protein